MKRLFFFVALFLLLSSCVQAQHKREFRGAWIQSVNGQFQNMERDKMQQTLTYQLDELQKDGVNAIIFQVRCECDALYPSQLEPWSRYLTGQQGKAPSPYWDPLQWMVDECHRRGMELHAWINPYRAKTSGTKALASNHVCVQHPDRYFPYGEAGKELYILNPALKENRDFICEVARDIITRYDVDGFHIDDYFYPYPVSGHAIPDAQDFQRFGQGFRSVQDWRRDNVNVFIKQLYETIHSVKPWVKFGVSPFGIYRNQKSDPQNGSATNGLQNYDDLYADVLMWVNNGWVDYCVPQIYWEIGNKAADYETLIHWWNRYAGGRPLYIGEDIERTAKHADKDNPNINQMEAKFRLHEQSPNVQGTVLWYAKAAVDNTGNYGTMLRQKYWTAPALQPSMPWLDDKAPAKPQKIKAFWTKDGYILMWFKPKFKQWGDEVTRYAVYRFAKGEKVDINDPSKIVTITPSTFIKLPYQNGKTKYTYLVTSLDRVGNESVPAKAKVKL